MTELTGMVLAVQANFYRVKLDANTVPSLPQEELLCTRRARLKKIGQQVCVGDRVVVEEPDWQGRRGAIAAVTPRRNQLDRPPLANVDTLLLVFALTEPKLEPLQLSRFLVSAESSGLVVRLCLSKRDLVRAAEADAWRDRLRRWGYESIAFSTVTGDGLDLLRASLPEGITVLTGPSGVGKSSLIDMLIPGLNLRTAAVSQRLGHGRHTTRHVELYPLGDRRYLADTPGYIQPSLTCSPQELADFFPEARARMLANACQFHDCLHRDEPDCAVQGDWERYAHYCIFLDEVQSYSSKMGAIAASDVGTKSKSGSGGKVEAEPMLLRKKHRRTSRRSERQDLDFSMSDDF